MSSSRKRMSLALLLGTLVAVAACHDADRYVLTSEDSIGLDRLFTLAAVGDTVLPADGYASVQLVARVRDVSEGAPSILFTTTAGSLRVGPPLAASAATGTDSAAAGPDSMVVPADGQGEARVELVSPSRGATAHVRAEVLGVTPLLHQDLSVRFTEVTADAMLAFVTAPATALAYGLELVPFSVQVPRQLDSQDRLVRFETNRGYFPFGADTTARFQIVRADTAGIATAYLRTPAQPGEARVRAAIGTFYQETTIEFLPVVSDSILSFVAAPDQAEADGQTLTRLAVQISPLLLRDADRTVKFETTAGVFVPAASSTTSTSVQADASGLAAAYLRSPLQLSQAVVRATVKGFTQEHSVEFTWAQPDSIIVFLDQDQASLKATGQVEVTAHLVRLAGRGKVTRDMEVRFEVADSLGTRIPNLRFANVTRTDTTGQATALLIATRTAYRGPATISARPVRLAAGLVGRETVTITD